MVQGCNSTIAIDAKELDSVPGRLYILINGNGDLLPNKKGGRDDPTASLD